LINPFGAAGGQNISVTIGGTIYYNTYDSAHGFELWKTDGTAAGTNRVADLNPGSGSSNPGNFFNFNGTLLFEASTGTQGYLFRSDGTAAGTTPIVPLGYETDPQFTQIGNELYFFVLDSSGNQDLYRTDGTAAGTNLVLNLGTAGATMANLDGTLYYFASPSLWKLDARGQPEIVTTFPAYLDNAPYSGGLTAYNHKLYVTAPDPTYSEELDLWASDGTAAGTSLLWSWGSPGPSNDIADAEIRYGLGDFVYFTTEVGGLYRTDGTAAGTIQLASVNDLFWLSSYVHLGNNVYFIATTRNRPYAGTTALWTTDGTVAGTRPVAAADVAATSDFLLATDDAVYFIHYGLIYDSDGTSISLADPTQSAEGWNAHEFLGQSMNGLVFDARTATSGDELWNLSQNGPLPPPPAPVPPVPPPPPPSPLTVTLGKVNVKTNVIAGARLGGTVPVVVTNSGPPFSSDLAISVYIGTGMTIDGTQMLLVEKTRRVSLKTGQQSRFIVEVSSLPATLVDGTYHLLVQATDPSGDTSSTSTSQAVQVTARSAASRVSITAIHPSRIAPGHYGWVDVLIENQGNVPLAGGTLTLALSDSDSQASLPNAVLDHVHVKVPVPVQRTVPLNGSVAGARRIRVHFRVPPSTAPGDYNVLGQFTVEGTSSNIGVSSLLTVLPSAAN
jgi:ELWxxDGT repeat protein